MLVVLVVSFDIVGAGINAAFVYLLWFAWMSHLPAGFSPLLERGRRSARQLLKTCLLVSSPSSACCQFVVAA